MANKVEKYSQEWHEQKKAAREAIDNGTYSRQFGKQAKEAKK